MEFFQELGALIQDEFSDPLGEFYMQYISHGRLGQYFTPEPITTLMATINIQKPTTPGQTVLDPACGSGRTLLAAARIDRSFLLYGADLDPICCKMTVINMLLHSLEGEVANMNSLSNEFFKGYQLRTKLIDGYYYPYFIEFTEPEKSAIWLHPKSTEDQHEPSSLNNPIIIPRPIQGTLF